MLAGHFFSIGHISNSKILSLTELSFKVGAKLSHFHPEPLGIPQDVLYQMKN